jgi:branched-chain amino acid transport system substrate-binding protein
MNDIIHLLQRSPALEGGVHLPASSPVVRDAFTQSTMRQGHCFRRFIPWLILSAMLLAAGPAIAEDVIKLGCAISFTGSQSRSGKLYIDSYRFAVEKVNASGGVKVGDKAYQMQLVFHDDQSDPTESSRLVEKLIAEDRVHFLLGPYSSGITIPDSIVARRYRVPMIEGGGASSKIFDKGNRYIFGTLPRAEDYFVSTLDFLSKQIPRAKTLAIIYSDDKFDVSVAQGTRAEAGQLGFKVVIYEKYSENATDFSSALTKAKAAEAQAILVAGHSEEAINIVHQAKELNVSPYFLSLTVGPTEADFRKALGRDADYIYGVASWSPQMEFAGKLFKDTQSFVREFRAALGYDPDYHNASGVAGVAIFKDAIERAGSLDREKVRDAIAATDLDTIYGKVDFLENGQIRGTSVVLQVLEGEIYQVYPSKGKAPVYPMPAWDKR